MVGSHGRFVWYELMTTDMEAAKAFYAEVVGWDPRDASSSIPYTLFTVGEVPVSGLIRLSEDARRMGVMPSWLGYVGVDNVDGAANRVEDLGGAVHVQPQDISNISRFSVVADPEMARFALFKWLQPGYQQAAELRKPGRVGWHELFAADWEKAWAFYSELFGWQKGDADIGAMGTYQQFSAGGETIGGMYTKPPIVPVPFWLYYFNVGDIEAAARRVQAGNGQVIKGPIELPGGNCVVQCMDPQGAVFALLGHNSIGYFERAASRQGGSHVR